VKSVGYFIVKPLNDSRYNNKIKVGDKELILNSDNYQNKFVNRHAKVLSIQRVGENKIKAGDEVIIHHNIFRRWKDIKGIEKNSKSYYKDNMYFVSSDQVFLYKNKDTWKANEEFCFLKPIKSNDKFNKHKQQQLLNIIKYTETYLIKAGEKISN